MSFPRYCTLLFFMVGCAFSWSVESFAPSHATVQSRPTATVTPYSTTSEMNALWRHWIPDEKADIFSQEQRTEEQYDNNSWSRKLSHGLIGACIALLIPTATLAVSGGGLDYAGLDITGQDFSNSNYKGKDFTQVIAKGTNFAKSNLQGCRFYKAYLVNTDYTGSDLRGASLEDTSMDGAILKDVQAAGAYFSKSLLDVATLENGDFTDASIPPKTLSLVCEREDTKGTNPVTGVDTRDSLMCP